MQNGCNSFINMKELQPFCIQPAICESVQSPSSEIKQPPRAKTEQSPSPKKEQPVSGHIKQAPSADSKQSSAQTEQPVDYTEQQFCDQAEQPPVAETKQQVNDQTIQQFSHQTKQRPCDQTEQPPSTDFAQPLSFETEQPFIDMSKQPTYGQTEQPFGDEDHLMSSETKQPATDQTEQSASDVIRQIPCDQSIKPSSDQAEQPYGDEAQLQSRYHSGDFLLIKHGRSFLPGVVDEWPWVSYFSKRKSVWFLNDIKYTVLPTDIVKQLEVPEICVAGFRLYYKFKIFKGGTHSHYIDAKDTTSSNWMRYVNCALSELDQNLVAFQYKGEIYYRCIITILPKTELLVWYGDDCVRELGISRKMGISKDSNNGIGTELAIREGMSASQMVANIERVQIKVHSCPFCGKVFDRNGLLQRHVCSQTGENLFTCSACGKQFSIKNFKHHLVIHNLQKECVV